MHMIEVSVARDDRAHVEPMMLNDLGRGLDRSQSGINDQRGLARSRGEEVTVRVQRARRNRNNKHRTSLARSQTTTRYRTVTRICPHRVICPLDCGGVDFYHPHRIGRKTILEALWRTPSTIVQESGTKRHVAKSFSPARASADKSIWRCYSPRCWA